MATRRHGDVPAVAAAATFDPGTGRVSAYLTNRSAEPATVTIQSRGTSRAAWSGRLLVADDKGPRDRTAASAYGFTPLATPGGAEPDTVTVSMPPESWAALTTTT